MKKVFTGLFVLVFVMGMIFANAPQIAQAASGSSLAPGDWQVPAPVIGTVVEVTAVGAPSYLQLLTVGIKITAPALICHEFRGAGYNWVGEIRQLVDKTWVKVKTTTALVPATGEGVYTACAQANTVGTYALFAYYHVAVEAVAPGNEEIVELSGKWNRGNVVSLDFTTNPKPEWLDNYSNGISVLSSGELCHPFPAGPTGMTAEIRELKDGVWVRIPTTFKYLPAAEGVYTACVMAPEAGTYTLFGYVQK
ncbi:MAG: hypothetical protein C0410_13780 [Anaerolinea sp.]|nr:hypothetical protein [Anaerolinea sp.]